MPRPQIQQLPRKSLAHHTQSEITAELSDPELSGDLLNSVTPMQQYGMSLL